MGNQGPPDGRLVLEAATIAKLGEVVIANLEKYQSDPIVWSKYRWVAGYHNSFVEECVRLGHCSDELSVDRKYATTSIRRLPH